MVSAGCARAVLHTLHFLAPAARSPHAQIMDLGLDIINELNAILDMNTGGEMASNLRKLYCFMTKHLTEANMKRDPEMIREVIKLMEELNQSWKAISG
ncbi:MAG: flagellar export chaperone FliS [Sedimentisphaerales bacterium]